MRFGISESQSGDDPDAWVREGMPHEGKKPVVRVDREEDWIIPTMG
jgi:hypothetical protein